jgi:hypothetical protein
MFFVLNAGRSGSRAVAETLSQSPNCECRHEPYPQLARESVEYLYGQRTSEELVGILRDTRAPTVDGRIYGETNHRLSWLIRPLIEAFPDAQLVWLLRDGRDFVSSGYQRGWYDSDEGLHPSDDFRRFRPRGDRVRDCSANQWHEMSRFEKICWQWSFTNRTIQSELERARPADYRVVRIEFLGERLPELCDWLGIEPVDFVISRSNAREQRGEAAVDTPQRNVVDEILTWTQWSPEQRQAFERHCASMMDDRYPGWRDESGRWQVLDDELEGRSRLLSASGVGGKVLSHPGKPDPGRANWEEALLGIRSEIAELRVLRGQHASLLTTHKRLARLYERSEEQLGQLAREMKREARETKQDPTPSVNPLEGEVRALERQLLTERHRRKLLEGSVSHRIGRGLVSVARGPLRVVGRLRSAPRRPEALAGPDASKEPDGASQATAKAEDLGRSGDGHVNRHEVRALFLVLGADASRVEDLVEEVGRLQLMMRSFRPFFMTDCAATEVFIRHGYPFDYVTPFEEWVENRGVEGWSDYVDDRVRSILDAYSPDRTIVVEGGKDLPAIRRGFLNEVLALPPGSKG